MPSSAIQTTYMPYKGTGDLVPRGIGGQVPRARWPIRRSPTTTKAGCARSRWRWRKRSPQLPDVPTFRELGLDWVDGGYGGIGVPNSTPMDARRRLSDLSGALNTDPEMKELATKGGLRPDRHQRRCPRGAPGAWTRGERDRDRQQRHPGDRADPEQRRCRRGRARSTESPAASARPAPPSLPGRA